jgi:hypothetical protein
MSEHESHQTSNSRMCAVGRNVPRIGGATETVEGERTNWLTVAIDSGGRTGGTVRAVG